MWSEHRGVARVPPRKIPENGLQELILRACRQARLYNNSINSSELRLHSLDVGSVALYYLGIPLRGILESALLCGVVHMDDAKSLCVTERPLEVIEQ